MVTSFTEISKFTTGHFEIDFIAKWPLHSWFSQYSPDPRAIVVKYDGSAYDVEM